MDWEQAYLDLLAYKERRGLKNYVIRPEVPRKIIENVNYTLVADEAVVMPRSLSERTLLQEAVTRILRKYADNFYRNRREKWDGENLVYKTLDKSDPNLSFNRELVQERPEGRYFVKVRRSDKELIAAIDKLREDVERLRKQDTKELPRIYFDRHLYMPLLLKKEDRPQTVPPGLEKSEAQFVSDLKDYWAAEKDKSLAGKEVFLLRNLSQGSGVGFFEGRWFYPDFILWLVDTKIQRVVFIEPHGMIYAKAYDHDEKARLHERLAGLAEKMRQRSKIKKDIMLDSFIISATKYDDLHERYENGAWDKEKFAAKHILFQERGPGYDYLQILFASMK